MISRNGRFNDSARQEHPLWVDARSIPCGLTMVRHWKKLMSLPALGWSGSCLMAAMLAMYSSFKFAVLS